ncbi:DUF4062 domain-containing protein [Candidatus Latescibacterota bacterium]
MNNKKSDRITYQIVRVFISSTFRDMQAERDHLVRFVFPRLREQLLQNRIHLVDVDLRWGVTSEQDASEVCREIINECHPRFLCMLGGRYGCVPPGETHSITADEIYYGVLDRTLEDRGFAYFYFRDDATTATMLETTSGKFREPQGSNNQKKLTELKQAIIAKDLNPFTYSAQWDNESKRLIGLKTFGDRIYDDLLGSMKSDPELQDCFVTDTAVQLDEFVEENAAMEMFVEKHSEHFVLGSRDTVLNELLDYANTTSGNGYACLTGAPGSGKSSLLAHLSRHSILNSQRSTLLLSHFVGVSPSSTDVRRTLRRLCHELKERCSNITANIPDDPEELRVAFPDFLRQACVRQRVVILLDAVNQFDSTSHSAGLHWMPEDLPANTRVILSTINGPVMDELLRFLKPREIELKPITAGDGKAIIKQFLKRYHKQFEPEQRAALLSKTEAGTPLYLLVALEELRTLGTYKEISQRIAELPSTTCELFIWILERLKDDDGFRDSSGLKVGHELVSRFAALLGASRYGLSQRELFDLLDAGDPQGNVAALLHLLSPYLMHRAELLYFYHDQFQEAVKHTSLKTDAQRQAAHSQLADYFHHKADPEGKQLWQINRRLLGELPYHLAQGARETELCELFSQLAFLSARVATNDVYELVADYSLAGSPLPLALVHWHDFLKKHTQKLTEHPTMLVALANHEGFSEARAQAAKVLWCQPWLRTAPEQMPEVEESSKDALHVQITGKIEFPWRRVSAIAPQQEIAFCMERLGTLRVIDLNTMQQTDTILAVRRDRPLVMACAPDATSLAILYESGKAELYNCVFGQQKWPTKMRLVVEFSFHLTESEDPVVVWNNGAFWYQLRADALACISNENPQAIEETLPDENQGEVSAIVFAEGTRLVALRQGFDTLLFAPGVLSLRWESAHAITACACGARRIAIAFTDGTLVVFEVVDTLIAKTEVRFGMLRGTLGWDGSRLLWLGETTGFSAWCPEEASPLPVIDKQEVFPSQVVVLPRQWLSRSDGSMVLGTTHSLVAFSLLEGEGMKDGRVEDIFGGPVWRAVCKRGNDQWLLEKQSLREVLLGRNIIRRLYCASDGKGRFFVARGSEPGMIFDSATFQSRPLEGCPPGINTAVGEDEGGCWFTDRIGDIYFADSTGQCRCAAKIGLPDVHGSLLENCGNFLVWVGYSSKFFPESGTEPARTLVFFGKVKKTAPMLERLGEQLRHPREGLCIAICYDKVNKRLVTLWVKVIEGTETYYLRVGSVNDFICWHTQEINVTGLGPYRFVQANLSADSKLLGVVNIAGEISCLSVADGRVRATLAPDTPFSAVVPGAEGSKFWVVDTHVCVYGCTLIEETT